MDATLEDPIYDWSFQMRRLHAEIHLAFYEGFESKRIDPDVAWDNSHAKRIFDLRPGSEWFDSHGDNRPPENEKFLSCNMNQGGVMAVTWWDKVHNHWKATGGQTYYQFTHWTHLPNKPRVAPRASGQPRDGF